MPSITDIVAHPKTFLRANGLWPSPTLNVAARGMPYTVSDSDRAQVIPLAIRAKPGVTLADRHGVMLPVWEVVQATSMGAAMGYYLPWMPNSTKTMVIGDKADFFITDTMNGCTFAAGTGTTVRVAHVNYNTFNAEGVRQEGLPIDQGHMDAEVNRVMGVGAAVALRKAQYADLGGGFPNVTVIGVRQDGHWRFVYQRRIYINTEHTVQRYRLASVHSVR